MAGKGCTFQSLIDAEMTVTAFCHHAPCNHSQKLDLAKLRDRFGPDAPAMADDIVPIYTPDTSPNAYGKAKAVSLGERGFRQDMLIYAKGIGTNDRHPRWKCWLDALCPNPASGHCLAKPAAVPSAAGFALL
ncbi:hypothetical protein [Mesorhizobium sp.]|uniref:hypothetical protein n=1 Tax=Mesorhizobium sp. TaxID=1871066 RepID=UPI0025BA3EDB|nr:hypothetical protein [Mesorhizobium sp.]